MESQQWQPTNAMTDMSDDIGIPRSELLIQLNELITEVGGDPRSRDGKLVRQLLENALGLLQDGRDTGELKLLTYSLAELRHALAVFAEYSDHRNVSIFGSARTPPGHPDYVAAVAFARIMASRGWSSITGAGDGIMKAGHEGTGKDAAFGLAIRLPFEQHTNDVISGDPKLINFRYFFTRKTMFLSQSSAIAALPGGFGTQDEVMEALTLVQTGKTSMIPIVLFEGPGGTYWPTWDLYVRAELLQGGFISPEDTNLYYLAADPQDAADHVSRFYLNYHSSRYVGDDFVIRLQHPLTPAQLTQLNDEFGALLKSGVIHQGGPYDAEDEFLDLPRVAFTHTRRAQGLVRQLVDRINEFGADPSLTAFEGES